MKTRPLALGILGGVVGTILAGIVAWMAVVYTGAYDVAATDPHADPVRWTLDTTMHRSVASRAEGTVFPDDVTPEMVSEGAGHYAESCAHCHGAPGAEPAAWAAGMRPEPPHLVEAAAEWDPREIHWIVSNGIKMTGMPSFEQHHGPEALVAITAFVDALPGLSADDYEALTSASQGHHEAASEHGGG